MEDNRFDSKGKRGGRDPYPPIDNVEGDIPVGDSDTFTPPTFDSDTQVAPTIDFGFKHHDRRPPMDSDTFTLPTFDSDTQVPPPTIDFKFGHHEHRPPLVFDTPTDDSDTSNAPSLTDAPTVPWFMKDNDSGTPDFGGGKLDEILNDEIESTNFEDAGSSFERTFGFGNFRADFANDNHQIHRRQRDRR